MTDRLESLTQEWAATKNVELYLDRCQVDTPHWLVDEVWRLVRERRETVGKVVDFGAGDGRFARPGGYQLYVGYEIDSARVRLSSLPERACIVHECAFSDSVADADVCIGNPPFVRNQDLPEGWRNRAAEVIKERTGIAISGLANAWQYFAFLAISSTKTDGLVALVIPYEWVSRPSAKSLRNYIATNKWEVATYKLTDGAFGRVLTTSAIIVIDKRSTTGIWRYNERLESGEYKQLASPSGHEDGVWEYTGRSEHGKRQARVKRGLSPGNQKIFALTEGERVRYGLQIGRDVVSCVTTLRRLGKNVEDLDAGAFQQHFRDGGARCWLVRTDLPPSTNLKRYLDTVPLGDRQTSTCLSRDVWWRFTMPEVPSILIATGFRGSSPKVVVNSIGAVAVGSVAGIYDLAECDVMRVANSLRNGRLADKLVWHSHGLKKLEMGQLATLVNLALSADQ